MDRQLAELERLLKQECEAHQRLGKLLDRKLAALKAGQRADVESLCEEENRCVQQVAELAKRRLSLVADLTQALDARAKAPLSLQELAERLAEPMRGRLLVLRVQLVEQMEQTKAQSARARQSTESLVRHMQGIMQTISTKLSGVVTYGRRGAPPAAAMALSTFSATA